MQLQRSTLFKCFFCVVKLLVLKNNLKCTKDQRKGRLWEDNPVCGPRRFQELLQARQLQNL